MNIRRENEQSILRIKAYDLKFCTFEADFDRTDLTQSDSI